MTSPLHMQRFWTAATSKFRAIKAIAKIHDDSVIDPASDGDARRLSGVQRHDQEQNRA